VSAPEIRAGADAAAVRAFPVERGVFREPGGRMLAVFGEGPPPVAQIVVSVQYAPNAWLETTTLMPRPESPPLSYLFAGVGAVLIVGLGAALIARQISRPMANLAAAAAQFAQGATDIRLSVEGPDDVRRASEAFNAMAARLGGQMRRQKQMLWALSHDLRTPITALRLRAELLEDSSARAKILAQLADMEALTEQALMLARAGAGEESVRLVDLSDIARTLCAEMRELGFSIDVAAPHSVFAPCRPDEIARAVRNLSENAAKYAGSGLISVSRGKDEAFVDVTDEGPGIAADLIGRVSEPFFRVDAARSDPGGAGLGLAIVQAIADSCGGRLVLENLRPRGLRARLVIPLRDS
jgi:signal transduction histidine kinase